MKTIVLDQKPTYVRGVPKKWLLSFAQILCASLFIGLCAQVKIPLPWTPVPITGQTFATLFIGCLLGSRKGALAALFYLIEGSLGLPVWSGGAAGFLHLMGPTGGYRIAYIVQVYLVGWYTERLQTIPFFKTASALFFSCILQMGLGVMWLGYFVGYKAVLLMGLYPFLPGEAIKSILVTYYLRKREKQ
jgi:biotin transport system substrate-specific component